MLRGRRMNVKIRGKVYKDSGKSSTAVRCGDMGSKEDT